MFIGNMFIGFMPSLLEIERAYKKIRVFDLRKASSFQPGSPEKLALMIKRHHHGIKLHIDKDKNCFGSKAIEKYDMVKVPFGLEFVD